MKRVLAGVYQYVRDGAGVYQYVRDEGAVVTNDALTPIMDCL